MNRFYKLLIIVFNIVAIFFLMLIFKGSYAESQESKKPLSDQDILLRQIFYGVMVSLITACFTLFVTWIFKKYFKVVSVEYKKIFFLQFSVLIFVYSFFLLYLYL